MKTKQNRVEYPDDSADGKRTYNVRLPDKMIADLEDLRVRLEAMRVLQNVHLGLEELGAPLSRANVLRSVIRRGIDATRKLVQPFPEQPLVPRDTSEEPSKQGRR